MRLAEVNHAYEHVLKILRNQLKEVENEKRKIFSDGLCIALLLFFFLPFPPAQRAQADVGGGKGYPATPWRIEGPKSITELEEAKTIAATYQTLSVSMASETGEGQRETMAFEQVILAALTSA